MTALLLDDNARRIQEIEEIAHKNNIYLTCSQSLEDALNRLKNGKYDFIFVDLIVPGAYGDYTLKSNAGFDFIRYIFENNRTAYMPKGVIVISDNIKKLDYIEELRLYPVPIVQTDDLKWKVKLQQIIDYYNYIINPVDLAIITAVDVEFSAIYNNTWVPDLTVGSYTFYVKNFKTKDNKPVNAVLVHANSKGMTPASAVTETLFKHYKPEKVFMIGIAGGNKNETNFGDIIVANQASDYGFGSITEKSNGELEFNSEPAIETVSDEVYNIFRQMSLDESIAYSIRKKAELPGYNSDVKIKLGLMASGPLVIKSNSLTEKFIYPFQKNYIGVDMETYAVYYSCKKNNCPFFVSIKSVSDHANIDKDNKHQLYCARLATQTLLYYIENIM